MIKIVSLYHGNSNNLLKPSSIVSFAGRSNSPNPILGFIDLIEKKFMFRKLIVPFVLLSVILALLNGCALLAVGAAGAAAGTTVAVATDARNSGTVIDDNTIETKLQLKYAKYPNSNIYVTSYNDVLLLTGQVPNKATVESAIFEAKVTPGVVKIYNYLQTRLPQSIGSISNDSLITTRIRTKLIGLKGVQSNHVKVVTTNGIVYLFGVVTPQQAKDIATSAASVPDVKQVVTLFEYVKLN